MVKNRIGRSLLNPTMGSLLAALIISFLFTFCRNTPPLKILDPNDGSIYMSDSISISVYIENELLNENQSVIEEEKTIKVGFAFHSISNHKLIIDWHAFSTETHNGFDQLKLDTISPHLDSIISRINWSQILLENREGAYRFFSSKKFYPQEGVIIFGEFYSYMFPQLDTILITKDDPFRFDRTIWVNDLKVELSDEEIRLHYLFVPDSAQTQGGFEPLIVTSNWLKLPSLE